MFECAFSSIYGLPAYTFSLNMFHIFFGKKRDNDASNIDMRQLLESDSDVNDDGVELM
jgi:hypothetical protein